VIPKDLMDLADVDDDEGFDSKGNFQVQQCRILDTVLFSILLDEMDVIIVIPKRLLTLASSRSLLTRHYQIIDERYMALRHNPSY
jgi:hypothetical protein